MAKRGIKDVEPEVELTATPTTSKKRKTSNKEAIVAPVPVKTQARAPRKKAAPRQGSLAEEKPVQAKEAGTAKKRKPGNAKEEIIASKVTKKRKVSDTKSQAIVTDVPIIHDDYETWPTVLSIIGRVTNARFNSKWPIYCYELEGQLPRWSWDVPGCFKDSKAIIKLQGKFDKAHRLGTARLKEGSDELEEACREHAIAPPVSAGAPIIPLKNKDGSSFAWFGSNGYTIDNPFDQAPVLYPNLSERSSEVESRPKAPTKKKRTTDKKNDIPLSSSSYHKEASKAESRPEAPMKKTKAKQNKLSSPSSPDPNESLEVKSHPKTFTKMAKKDTLSPSRTTSTENTNVSVGKKGGVSLTESRLQERNARKAQIDSLPPRVKISNATLLSKQRLMLKYSNYTHPAGATHGPVGIDPAEIPSDCVYPVKNSRSSAREYLHRDACMETTVVGLYRRRLSAIKGQSSRTATYTAIYTQDPELAVHKHQVEWFEDGKKQFYLIKWTEFMADGNKKHRQGFVYAEHLNQHVDYRPQIEEFEQEQMKAVYGDKDQAARQKREAKEKKEHIAVEKLLQRILEEEGEEESLRMRKSLAKQESTHDWL